MIRTIRELSNALSRLMFSKELLIKDETGKLMTIENVSYEKVEDGDNSVRYVLNCKKADDGCITYR